MVYLGDITVDSGLRATEASMSYCEVTGAGFIGSNFIHYLLEKYSDYRIICLDCLTYAGNMQNLSSVLNHPNLRFVKESITDRQAVYHLFEEETPDIVVNFAAESHVDRSIENPQIFMVRINFRRN